MKKFLIDFPLKMVLFPSQLSSYAYSFSLSTPVFAGKFILTVELIYLFPHFSTSLTCIFLFPLSYFLHYCVYFAKVATLLKFLKCYDDRNVQLFSCFISSRSKVPHSKCFSFQIFFIIRKQLSLNNIFFH